MKIQNAKYRQLYYTHIYLMLIVPTIHPFMFYGKFIRSLYTCIGFVAPSNVQAVMIL